MSTDISMASRRRFLHGLTVGAAAFTTRGLFAETLKARPTAPTTEGPFYPDKMPLDTDNDLLIINDAITPAVGAVTHLTGRVLTATGQPIPRRMVTAAVPIMWSSRLAPTCCHQRSRKVS